MGIPVRLDKYLADMKIGTRSEVKAYIRKGRVEVDGEVIKASDTKIDSTDSIVSFDKQRIEYEAYEYFMLNKPAGVVSATTDNLSKTVIDLITGPKKNDIFPVGRLDKDTEGLLLITNDGELAHKLLSPKRHVGKVYFVRVRGKITDHEIEIFQQGINLNKDFTTLPAELTILESAEISTAEVTVFEGKFHQVKRMFEAVDMEVVYLKRLRMGELSLDEALAPGEYRKLTKEELAKIKENNEIA